MPIPRDAWGQCTGGNNDKVPDATVAVISYSHDARALRRRETRKVTWSVACATRRRAGLVDNVRSLTLIRGDTVVVIVLAELGTTHPDVRTGVEGTEQQHHDHRNNDGAHGYPFPHRRSRRQRLVPQHFTNGVTHLAESRVSVTPDLHHVRLDRALCNRVHSNTEQCNGPRPARMQVGT